MVSCLVLFPVVNPLGFKQGLYFIFSCSFIFCFLLLMELLMLIVLAAAAERNKLYFLLLFIVTRSFSLLVCWLKIYA